MANYFPTNYQPAQIYYPQAQNQNQNNNGILWVQGEASAKSYLVAPNQTVQLWDTESQTIYVKSADASGMPTMRILDYTFRENMPQNKNTLDAERFATKEDVDILKEEINSLKANFDKPGKEKK